MVFDQKQNILILAKKKKEKRVHRKELLKRNRMTQISASQHLPLWSKRNAENLLDFGKNALL